MKISAEKEKKLSPLFLIILLGIGLYAMILNAPFCFDDNAKIVSNSALKDTATFEQIWKIPYAKTNFLTFVTFALNYRWGGMNPFGFHLVNIVLHLLSVFLSYRLVLIFFSCPAFSLSPLSAWKKSFALIAALIFLCHPLQTQSVTYVWARSEILSAIFCFLSLLFYMNGRLKNRKPLLFLSFFLFLIGIFARGNMIIFPLLVFLIEITFFRSTPLKITRLSSKGWLFLLGLGLSAILVGVFFSQLVNFFNISYLFKNSYMPRTHYLLTQFSVIVQYIKLCIIPLGQNLYYDFPFSNSLFEFRTFGSLMILLSILVSAVLCFKKHRLISFGIFWFFICLLPVSSIIPLSTVISESRVYLPLFGFSVLVTAFMFSFIAEKKKVVRIAFVVIMGLSALTIARNSVWRSSIAIMEDTVRKSPLSGRAQANLGVAYSMAGLYDKALDSYRTAFELGSKRGMDRKYLAQILINLSSIYGLKGDYEREIHYCQQAITYNSKNPQAYSNLGHAYALTGDYAKAITYGRKAVEISPTFVEGLTNLGVVYGRMGKYREAAEQFERALKLDRENEKAKQNLLLAQQLLKNSNEPAPF